VTRRKSGGGGRTRSGGDRGWGREPRGLPGLALTVETSRMSGLLTVTVLKSQTADRALFLEELHQPRSPCNSPTLEGEWRMVWLCSNDVLFIDPGV
jgi:hypothetical protein